ncbi:Rad17p NDAI_0A08830 [Naumovozyma dairenensis CBS 421]|uniref:DNA damage checkpoint control protein RAD17 n=1 Tax=Naumovozyma dairenensis (strain ATCC 10597 / BCRC 20456 / CBS 421 / NBRC 0211 / NRRL Y-12639) TaxID=1071378 RepID=G0W5E7_NAUDC|nr:hypothetical protein NDAI_0A08830 [Naumovozyma dairenensis CBS 421]CCD23035.1 hypothetical protein NDAI_0A08830 [Naumovozyma dairenensis CBS 421]
MLLKNIENTTKFSASTVHLDHLTTALNCLVPFVKTGANKDDVLIYVDKDGLSFIRESNHVIRIQLYLSKELFLSYTYLNGSTTSSAIGNNDSEEHRPDGGEDDHMEICVKINHILDSINVANRNIDDIIECTLSYNGDGYPFVLIFEDSFISEKVEYSTFIVKDMDNFGLILDKEHIIFECIIKGDVLYKALKDLKEVNCKECYIYAKTSENGNDTFAFISKSDLGYSKVRLPNSRSILEKLQIYENDSTTICHDVPAIGFFDFNSLDKIRISTKIASKVLLRMDIHGLLSVNILSQTEDIVITDVNKVDNNTSRATNRNMSLPKNYPGIVIDVTMLEKETIDVNAQRDIELLMETNEMGEYIINPPKSIKIQETSTREKLDSSINLLALDNSRAIKVPDSNPNAEESDDDDELNGKQYDIDPTNNLPLFF